jgi:hypothetical protein
MVISEVYSHDTRARTRYPTCSVNMTNEVVMYIRVMEQCHHLGLKYFNLIVRGIDNRTNYNTLITSVNFVVHDNSRFSKLQRNSRSTRQLMYRSQKPKRSP